MKTFKQFTRALAASAALFASCFVFTSAAPPECPETGQTIYANQKDCASFFECQDGVMFKTYCPQDLYYCPQKMYCSYIQDPDCSYDCELLPAGSNPNAGPCYYGGESCGIVVVTQYGNYTETRLGLSNKVDFPVNGK